MEDGKKVQHESYGMISISKFTSNHSQFFGSDLIHNSGVSITISGGEKRNHLSRDWFHSTEELIKVELSGNQFVDAITSGMNTSGVPCTITRFNGVGVEQTQHVEDKKEVFRNDMQDTHVKYHERISTILDMLDGNTIGKKKAAEIKHEIEILKQYISSNTNFVMNSFNEAMEKTVVEAKHSISNYIDSKVTSLGIEAIRDQLQVSIGNEDLPKIEE